MTEQDKDRQLLELVKTLRVLHGEVVSLRVEHERHVEQLREVSGHLTSGPCPLHVTDGRLVDGKGADVFFGGYLDFAGVLGRLRDVESRLATGVSRLAELRVPLHAPDPIGWGVSVHHAVRVGSGFRSDLR